MSRICVTSTIPTRTTTVGDARGSLPVADLRDAVAALGAYEAEITGGRVAFPMQRREHPLIAWRAGC